MKENQGKLKLVNLALLSWEAPEGSSSVQKASLPDVSDIQAVQQQEISCFITYGDFGVFLKLKIEENKGVWDNFFYIWNFGFFFKFQNWRKQRSLG